MARHHDRLLQRMHWIRKRCRALIRGSDYLIEFIGAFSKSRAHRAVRWISLILFLLIAIVLGFSTVWRVWVIKTNFLFTLGSGAVYVDWSPPLMRMAFPTRITKDAAHRLPLKHVAPRSW